MYLTGTNLGPKGMREASGQFLPYTGDFDVDLFETYRLVDCGDVPIVPANAQRSRAAITEYVGRILDADALPICVGGDHSIPIPIADALERRTAGRIGYITFDAHLDTAVEVDGEPYTNWSGTARMAERSGVDPENVAVVGVHGATNPREQFAYARELGINVYTMQDILRDGIDAVVTDALDRVTEGVEKFYVSWDTDVIDAAYMPGTGGPEPGGMTSREILRAAELVGDRHPALIDIVELLPTNDHPVSISCRLACSLAISVLGSMARSKQASQSPLRPEARPRGGISP